MQKVKKRSEMLTINCRYCQKEIRYNSVAEVPTFPFCSERCKLIDLGLWLDEKHRISALGGPASQEVEEKSSTQKNHEELEDVRDKG